MNPLVSVALTADDWEMIATILEEAEDIETEAATKAKLQTLSDEIICQVGAEEERIEEYEKARAI